MGHAAPPPAPGRATEALFECKVTVRLLASIIPLATKPRSRSSGVRDMPISTMKSAALVTFAALTALVCDGASATDANFRLFPNKTVRACFEHVGQTARATAKVTRGKLND